MTSSIFRSGLVRLFFSESSRDAIHTLNLAKLTAAQSKVKERLYIQFVQQQNQQQHNQSQPITNVLDNNNPFTKLPNIINVQSNNGDCSPLVNQHLPRLKQLESLIDTYYKIMYRLNSELDVTIVPHMATPSSQHIAHIHATQPVLPPLEHQVDALFVDEADRAHLSGHTNLVVFDDNVAYPTDQYKQSVFDKHDGSNTHAFAPLFKGVVLGGTFDHMHPGHKILLTMSALLCSEYMEIGVTDNSILKSKKYSELIAPFDQRTNKTYEFIKHVNPYVEYNMLRLLEPYANTMTSSRLEVIVISPETLKTALFINEKRKESNLKPLEIYAITYFDGVEQGGDFKLSSTYLRELEFKKLQAQGQAQ
ncbi:hypothetical protein SAMD00019534_032050 [Acytostelium subglobosum LB1]|uniref:hypothetical protein n=1 Tax=Acytostelium subglobosum LB1 TaxID=1410327 RepID=UPI000644BBDB|nr:hypothetical protein SAMD00019534_032050 [Acytostelium subglobosum LB1]GAM20030.1 hypothetical protein SAMD00019534_032050 [Acytostelium subglobosum LB1]|eukprot:XP_012756792.1 hypothetical protein SAMD00019534_032050 [Acytostelium subglobosum LB1]